MQLSTNGDFQNKIKKNKFSIQLQIKQEKIISKKLKRKFKKTKLKIKNLRTIKTTKQFQNLKNYNRIKKELKMENTQKKFEKIKKINLKIKKISNKNLKKT